MFASFTRLAPAFASIRRFGHLLLVVVLPSPEPDEEKEDSFGRGNDVGDRFNRTDDNWC